jgi:hypothetical protein
MRKVFSPYFYFCLVLFTLNQFIEKAGIFIPFVHSYLDDLLSAGIVMGFALSIQQQLTFKKPDYIFSAWHSVVYVVWYSLLFEWLFPTFDSRHHADVWDIVAYALGAFAFHQLGNRPVPKLLFRKRKKSIENFIQ